MKTIVLTKDKDSASEFCSQINRLGYGILLFSTSGIEQLYDTVDRYYFKFHRFEEHNKLFKQ